MRFSSSNKSEASNASSASNTLIFNTTNTQYVQQTHNTMIPIESLTQGNRLKNVTTNLVYIFYGVHIKDSAFLYKEGDKPEDCEIFQLDSNWVMASSTDANPPKKEIKHEIKQDVRQETRQEPSIEKGGRLDPNKLDATIEGIKRKKEFGERDDKRNIQPDVKFIQSTMDLGINTGITNYEQQLLTYQKHIDQLFRMVELEGELLKNYTQGR